MRFFNFLPKTCYQATVSFSLSACVGLVTASLAQMFTALQDHYRKIQSLDAETYQAALNAIQDGAIRKFMETARNNTTIPNFVTWSVVLVTTIGVYLAALKYAEESEQASIPAESKKAR